MDSIRIPADTALSEPIYRVIDGAEGPTALEVVVERGARAVVIEELNAANGSHSVEVTVEEEAELEFISINTAGSSDAYSIHHRSRLLAGSSMSWRIVTLGNAPVEHSIESVSEGANAVSSVDWAAYAKGAEKQQLSVRNIFNGLNGGGEITMKGIAEEKAHIAAKGLIEIGPKGNGTNTYLTQQVLMLDKTAKVDAVPSLEIKTNDVKASHSATVARVTEEDLFYFASRAIPARDARRMFVEGFLGDLIARISHAPTRERVMQFVAEKYGER